MSRETILGRIRMALGPEKEPARAHAVTARLADPPRHPRPAFATLTGPAREGRFIQCLENQGATVITIADLPALPAAVATLLGATLPPASPPPCGEGPGVGGTPTSDVLESPPPSLPHKGGGTTLQGRREPSRLFLADDMRLSVLPWPANMTPERWTPDQTLGDGTAALTHAEAGVAETGTLVLASSAASPASLAFLPEVHIVAVRRDTIAASFEDAFAALTAAAPARLPRAINLVSGPSRTADVGGKIVKGAHGPRRLAVILYGPPPAKTG